MTRRGRGSERKLFVDLQQEEEEEEEQEEAKFILWFRT